MTGTKRTLKFLRVAQLRIERLDTEVEDVILGSYSGLRRPELLTEDALLAVASHYPVSVCKTRNGDYRVVGNAHVAALLKVFAPDNKVQVLVWKHREAESQQVSRLLAALFFGLSSQNAFLRLWASLSEDERRWISSSLNTRVGLEEFAGISRKLRIQDEEPVLVPGLARHLLPPDESEEPEVDHHDALSEVDHPDLVEGASEAVARISSADIKPVFLAPRTRSILEYLLASSSEQPSRQNSSPAVPYYLSDALSQVGLLGQDNDGTVQPDDVADDAPASKILDAVKAHFTVMWQQAAEERESGLRLQLCATLTASCIEWLNDLHSDSLLKQFSNPKNAWAAISALSLDTIGQLAPFSPNAESLLHKVQDTSQKCDDGNPDSKAERRHLKILAKYLKGYLTAKSQLRLPLNDAEVA
ncbi:hypothetical protein B9Q17_11885 [Marinobacter vinifirmus]|uniref:Uncharacterized protein n=1 Tax=Marinobacter vinifirmus TaxID=355591 RepID=A0A7Z1DTK8_9GAMM|nr:MULTISPECIES: hypothetical protein [Marinobacter]MAO14464.1 hypothetical protein [Marinobacter sp.]OZC35773.1 hypothetical protein B9Q17_11885 [Marinobacter vinifirmus]